jgi:hypothetical protein
MKRILILLASAALAAGCACGHKADGAKPVQPQPQASPTPATQGHIPSVLEPNHGMSSSRAAGFGHASDFLK